MGSKKVPAPPESLVQPSNSPGAPDHSTVKAGQATVPRLSANLPRGAAPTVLPEATRPLQP